MGQHLLSDEPQVLRLVGLDRVLELARETTGARFAAVGILNERRTELDQFLTSGIDDATHRAIGHVPRGRGVLGELILQPQPLRCADVQAAPEQLRVAPRASRDAQLLRRAGRDRRPGVGDLIGRKGRGRLHRGR